jgi:hypothetical protein
VRSTNAQRNVKIRIKGHAKKQYDLVAYTKDADDYADENVHYIDYLTLGIMVT